jgi:hypothetical protein
MMNAEVALPDGFRLTQVDNRYELSWVNWRVRRKGVSVWLLLVFIPFLVVFSLIVTALIIRADRIASLGWVAFLCWLFAVAAMLAVVGRFCRETISLSRYELTYRSTMPLVSSFSLGAGEVTRVALEKREPEEGQPASGISPLLCVVHVTSPELLLAMNPLGRAIFYTLQTVLPFGRRWLKLPADATGWVLSPLWHPSVSTQVYMALRHILGELQWETTFESDVDLP